MQGKDWQLDHGEDTEEMAKTTDIDQHKVKKLQRLAEETTENIR